MCETSIAIYYSYVLEYSYTGPVKQNAELHWIAVLVVLFISTISYLD